MKTYKLGQTLISKKKQTVYQGIFKVEVDKGTKFKIIDTSYYEKSAFYILYDADNNFTLCLWNDENHEYIDENFKVVK